MKHLTKKQRKNIYLKMAKLEFNEFISSIKFYDKNFDRPKGEVFYNLFPELGLITGKIDTRICSEKEIQEHRIFGYLLGYNI